MTCLDFTQNELHLGDWIIRAVTNYSRHAELAYARIIEEPYPTSRGWAFAIVTFRHRRWGKKGIAETNTCMIKIPENAVPKHIRDSYYTELAS